MVWLYTANFLQRTCWHGADSWRCCSGGLYIPIKYRLIYQQRPSGMSCLHLNVKHLDWWQSLSTASTDSKSKITWWEWIVTLEACLGRNDTSIMNCSLSKLASYRLKNIILHCMGDFSCARTSIRGQETPGRERSSGAINTWAVSQYPILCDADLESARTSMTCQEMLQLCYN
jgi:hypothetical protein